MDTVGFRVYIKAEDIYEALQKIPKQGIIIQIRNYTNH